ncbi:hypothetical protein Tco_0774308 [Tanacetum coccineum]|uniref:Uncharacterized protein n=1 Tax=Tanacetum coccineum TaxID=301880 RepID=A0ABQ4ZR78_9ASTR
MRIEALQSLNNEAPVINAEPISVVHPLNIDKKIVDSHNISFDDGGLSLIGLDAPSYLEEGKRSMIAGKRKVVERGSPLDVDSDPDIYGKLDPSTYLREISIEQLCDIHDKAYMRQAVLDNVLNGRTQELISGLHKARASCDTMSMASTEVDSLRHDRAVVALRVILDAVMKLIHSDEMGVLIARLVKASIIYGRCTAFEEVAELKKPFVLEEMSGYCPSSKKEYDQAGNDLANASYPFLAELTADPHAYVEQLLSKKPQLL